MKLIELTISGSQRKIHISTMLIAALEDIQSDTSYEAKTIIHLMGGNYWHVMESIDEIQKKIEDSERLVFRYDQTGPR